MEDGEMNDFERNGEFGRDSNYKRVIIAVVLVMAIIVTTAGGTYAYLAISATATNNITGNVASAGLSFSVNPDIVAPTKGSAYETKPLVPQYAYNDGNVLQSAITGVTPSGEASAVPCVDANGNAVCKVYTFTVRNDSSASVSIDGKISFTTPTPNLKWAPMTSDTTVVSIGGTTDANIHAATVDDVTLTDGAGDTTWSLPANGTKQFWIVFWINEIGVTQNDSGTWYATIKFNSSNGKGITSTITS